MYDLKNKTCRACECKCMRMCMCECGGGWGSVHVKKREIERDTLSETVVSLRTMVTFVTWLISRIEFSSSELVL